MPVMLSLLAALVLRPALPTYRWVYVMTNLQVKQNADMLAELIPRAKRAGYNGIVLSDSKFARLGDVPTFYFDNAKRVIGVAKENGIDLIPCVWPVGYASAMLGHDVNLVEGPPVKDAPFVVHGAQAWPQNRANLLTNGGLEQAANSRFAGLSMQDGPGASTNPDTATFREGKQSVRMDSFKQGNDAGNARLVWTVQVQPWHQYRLSAWFKTENLKGYVQAMALDEKGQGLVVNETSVGPTQDWTETKVSLNSLGNSQIKIYLGVWGGSAGKIWWDDARLEDAGLLNVIRRPGCPVRVRSADGTTYTEGKDYAEIRDPGLGVKPWAGEYDVDHDAPAIQILPGSRIHDGETLRVSFYHAKTGIGNQASICLSEPKTAAIMEDEAKRVADLFKPRGLFWSHDEIRIGGWCEACQKRALTPGGILADNARLCAQIQSRVLKGSESYVWSDMFDPSHNAVDNYYLTNGTLAKSWEGLSKDVIVVNWNSGKPSESLPFFAGRGHRQILAGYYDGPVDSIKPWLREAAKVKGVVGVMYTTWVGNYKNLEAFAQAAWGASAERPNHPPRPVISGS